MKKKTIIIIGIFTSLFVSWFYISLDEFYQSGQTESYLTFIPKVSTDKLSRFAIALLPVAIVSLFAFKKNKKSP